MKSTVDQLGKSERQALARLYDTDGYKALVKLCELEIVGLGKDALASSHMDGVNFLKGRASLAKELPLLIREIYTSTEKS